LRKVLSGFFVFFSLLTAPGGASPPFETVSWGNLSDKDISIEAGVVLHLNPDSWKHSESAHFVYHFTNAKEAETVILHAEVYYGWIKDMFGVTQDEWKKKVHVFIFEDEKVWEEFKHRGTLEPMIGADAFTTGRELFIHRASFWLAPQKTLAHEITHVVVFRFLDGPIPLFLNEGFAEFMSYRAVSLQADGDEFRIRTIRLIPEDRYIPLKKLADTVVYPKELEEVRVFYQESELLARYLILSYEKTKFYSLLKSVSQSKSFAYSLHEVYGLALDELEEKFKAYAIQSTSS
jgi:hypothetical protein